MNLKSEGESEARFKAYVAGLASVVGHVDRAGPLRDYCTGLMLPGERKSVEPMAAKTAPSRTSAQHQSLLHFVGVAAWSDEKVLAKVRDMVLPAMERHGPIEAWIIDDTGFPKHGKHSVGVQVQYCGQLGKEANCQVAVSLSMANHAASLPVAYQLYLPKEWTADGVRRKKAGVPRDIRFKTKPEIALPVTHRHDGLGVELCGRHSTENAGVATRHWTEAERQAAEQYGPSRRTYAYDGDRLVRRGGLSTHKHVFKSELKSC